MRGLLAILALLLLFANASHAAGEWNVVKHEGRDYVPLENVGRFYQLGPLRKTGGEVGLRTTYRSLRGRNGSREFYINNLKFILSYPIADIGGRPYLSRMDLTKLIEPVLRPGRIGQGGPVTTVVLDAGHGGHDNGATSPYGSEKNFTLDVAFRTRALLQAAGVRVVMTRSSDVFVPLDQRARFANRFPNALFISIHFNSGRSAATGLETYTLAPRGVPSMASDGPALSDFVPCPGNARDAENMALACATHAALVANSGLYDRGIKRARFVVIRDVTIPGVLIEGGFLSNPGDARLVATAAYRQKMASSIAQAVRNYRAAVSGPRAPVPVVSIDTPEKPKEPTVVTPTTNHNR